MSMNKITFVLAMVAVFMTGCAKHELETATLTTNPFDADYDGPAVFTLIDASTGIEEINSIPVRVLTVRVRVHTEYFGRPTTYIVTSSRSVDIPSNSIPDGVLTIRILGVDPGEQLCTSLRLKNDGAIGAGNTVCATAE
jgi:hypothetical protein